MTVPLMEVNHFERVRKMERDYSVPIYRIMMVKDSAITTGGMEKISSPRDANDLLSAYLEGVDREHFVVLLLDTKNNIVGINTVSIGTLNASIVHPREVFKPAILENAGSVILAHNHPSGDPTPSQEDLEITRRLFDGGKILGIDVRDHIIIGDGCFFSFRERGML